MKKVVLAFSGGLDTSYCAKYLSESLGYEVVAVTVNTGGFSKEKAVELERKARVLGVSDYQFIDKTSEFYKRGVKYLLYGNVLKNNTYPLSVSAERVFQAMAIAEVANSVRADAIAHGSTGAGNDQIRFDLVFQAMCPGVEIITPIRDRSLSRQEEIEFLKEHGVEGDWTKALYSINQGLWGTSVGGKETLTSHEYLPDEAFPSQATRDDNLKLRIEFDKGEPIGLDGKKYDPVQVITRLNEIGNEFAIGRDIHVGDTIIGIKGRVGFEAPAALMLIKGHHALEKHVMTKHQLFIKDQLSQWYGNLMHEGQFLEPAMRDIEAFLESSQHRVTGTVYFRLSPYRFHVEGIKSEFDLLQSDFGQYGEMNNGWSAEDARGFTTMLSNQIKLYNSVKK